MNLSLLVLSLLRACICSLKTSIDEKECQSFLSLAIFFVMESLLQSFYGLRNMTSAIIDLSKRDVLKKAQFLLGKSHSLRSGGPKMICCNATNYRETRVLPPKPICRLIPFLVGLFKFPFARILHNMDVSSAATFV